MKPCFLFPGNFTEPPNFPKSLQLTLTDFQNWGESIKVKNVWTVEPKNSSEILQVVNWARQNGYQVRATGLMRNWSPLTLEDTQAAPVTSNHSESPPKFILLKMATNLNRMGLNSNEPGGSTFWAET